MNMESLFRAGRKHNASDIHVVVGLPPVFRINGEISVAKGDSITTEVARHLVYEGLRPEHKERLDRDLMLCYSATFGVGDRVRVSIYFRNGCPEMSIRLSEQRIRTREELGLPTVVDELARKPSGLVIITGPTGVGKTTTFHYMLDLINAERRGKILTIEDPIEFVHASKRSIVVQQEVLSDVHDFRGALIHALRLDPDIIGIGEMRDAETVHTALTASETGHLVIATLHTPSTVETLQRLISTLPPGQQDEISFMLANTLQGVIAQQLLPRSQGNGRVLCTEVLIGTAGVRNHIRLNEMHKVYSEIQSGQKVQMHTMDHSLLKLYEQGEITYDTALSMARYPDSLRDRMA